MSQLQKGRDLVPHLKAPKGKAIISVDTSGVDTLSFDIKRVTMGNLVDGLEASKGQVVLFGDQFKVMRSVSDKEFHFLVMKEDNVEAFLEVPNE